ncbi:MAG: hypothetical protein LBN19_03205 [Endomicrobium sp.]|jgi:hypothetical protein|nr:hypothetical protein [Endomicrobium sp.]
MKKETKPKFINKIGRKYVFRHGKNENWKDLKKYLEAKYGINKKTERQQTCDF